MVRARPGRSRVLPQPEIRREVHHIASACSGMGMDPQPRRASALPVHDADQRHEPVLRHQALFRARALYRVLRFAEDHQLAGREDSARVRIRGRGREARDRLCGASRYRPCSDARGDRLHIGRREDRRASLGRADRPGRDQDHGGIERHRRVQEDDRRREGVQAHLSGVRLRRGDPAMLQGRLHVRESRFQRARHRGGNRPGR